MRAAAANRIPTMTKFPPQDDDLRLVREGRRSGAVEIDADDVTAEWCKAFHVKGIKVQAKVRGATWDNPTVSDEMLDSGVDWFQTDDPAGVRFAECVGEFPSSR